MDIKFGKEDGEGIQIKIDKGKVFIQGTWKGRMSKSKDKGNWNMSWHSEELFKQMCKKSLEVLEKGYSEKEKSEDDEDIPF